MWYRFWHGMYMRRGRMLSAVIILTLLISFGLRFTEAQREMQAKIQELKSATPMPIDLEALPYFADIDDALLAHTFSAEYNPTQKDAIEHIQLFVGDEEASLAFRYHYDGDDWFFMYKFALKHEGDTLLYSRPIEGMGFSWKAHAHFLDEMAKRDKNVLLNELTHDIRFYNHGQDDNVYPDATLWWGLSQTADIVRVKISGEPLTEVIPIQMDGEEVLFWYLKHPDPDAHAKEIIVSGDFMEDIVLPAGQVEIMHSYSD